IGSAALLFGAMRLAHSGSAWATARMAEGRWGRGLGYRFGYRPFGGEMAITPTGRWMFGKFGFAAGGGIPTFNRTGKFLSGTMNHLGGMLAMTASGYASRKLGFIPGAGQSFGVNFFEAAVQYVQAMAGFNLANGLTSGRLQSGLGTFKMRLD